MQHDHHDHGHDAGDHERGHDHAAHGHDHAPRNFGRAFAIGTTLNAGFVIAEVIAGIASHSMALIADAGHNLGDVLGLLMAWVAAILARRAPTPRYSYGLGRGTILAALVNATILLVSVGAIAVEAIRRLVAPQPIDTVVVVIVAGAGIAVNGVTAWLFAAGRKGDLNIRAAFQHMAYDALVSLGVVVAGAAILLTGWERLDPIASLAIAGIILAGTWGLLRDSAGMAMDAVPRGIAPERVRAFVLALPEVASVHDLHIWPMSTTETALTLHLVTPAGHPGDGFVARLVEAMHERFDIDHTTVQIELDEDGCLHACEHALRLHAPPA
ncbi:MAG: cation diffusion facilitator family transporter [Acidiphilium sp.]|nr:cation diffusion facilitator family transporter [Acidiphilium sp.]MDD4936089.1 cation diffusion facilitator family transporter [Acidiphilium sp.]